MADDLEGRGGNGGKSKAARKGKVARRPSAPGKKAAAPAGDLHSHILHAFHGLLGRNPKGGLVAVSDVRDVLHQRLGEGHASRESVDRAIKDLVRNGKLGITMFNAPGFTTPAALSGAVMGTQGERWSHLEKPPNRGQRA